MRFSVKIQKLAEVPGEINPITRYKLIQPIGCFRHSASMHSKTTRSEGDGILLLRQVSADVPFQSKFGKLGRAWNRVANALKACDGFTRQDVDGRKCQNRFMELLVKHEVFSTQPSRILLWVLPIIRSISTLTQLNVQFI